MIYITAQPRIKFYAWQVEVMINNFIKNKVDPASIHVLVGWNSENETALEINSKPWEKLSEKYKEVKFFQYPDSRSTPVVYVSSIRPHILAKHFEQYPELEKEVFLYHDCDVALTKEIDFSNHLKDDVWYGSDTGSYLNSQYILSKGKDVLDLMCSIVGIDPSIVERNSSGTIGAQYILKKIDSSFWLKVERDSVALFDQVTKLNNQKILSIPDYHPLQIWCADMWAVLWNGWLRGIETRVSESMSFCWPNQPLEKWESSAFFHNSGVLDDQSNMFYKGKYMYALPYGSRDIVNEHTCSYKYYQEIKAVDSCLY